MTGGNVIATTGRYSFNASKMTGKYGWVFTMKNMPDNLKAFTYTTVNGEVYIPWRYWDTVGYRKKSGSYKMIVGWLRNDAGQQIRIRFNLPWAYWSNYITVNECNTIVDNVVKWGSEQKRNINTRKRSVDSYFEEMLKSKKALDTSKDDAAALKKKLQENIQKNQGLLTTKKTELAAISKQVGDINTAVQGLNAQVQAVTGQINQANTIYDNNLRLIDDQERQKVFAKIEGDIKHEVDEIAGDIQSLQQTAANVNFDVIAAAASKGDATQVTTLLLGVQPATSGSA
jgi:polyhydroxyalkanoate synthesis regulator protein